ncbi:DnaD domain-containing protein [Gracilibacillus massiliensis]|uniref:DnaD domain-containing protein n=1 Tax=Gracilibacillus massiliensis TaxID=1564956 RepID=UPI00071C5D3F|nr:DnaD domain-containing protein [Gracilibacillus massiliensis]
MKQKLQYILQDQINIPMLLIEKHAALGITESQLAIILQIHVTQQKGNFFPTPEEIAEHLTISSEECSSLLRQLIQRDLLSIEEDKGDEMIKESYSLERLWQKIYSENEPETKEEEHHMGEVFQKFEREFGRPLSPFEIEMINNWLDEDEHDTSMIYAALREAVLMGKVNFKYIDRILMEWQRKGIKSVQQAQKTSKAFHQNNQTGSAEKKEHPYDKSLYYNWLEE